MAGRETTPLSKKLSGSIGAGLGALTSGGREYYVLEHKSDTKRYNAGTQQEIIVNYLELGRDARCGVRFSEQESTVSRKHAAISKEGNSWVISNLSQTNPTLLNGRPVNQKWYLNSGDEIQLSLEGPRLGFIVPNNNKTGTLTIGKRMTLFGQQALRPYKQAIYALIAALIIVTGGSFYFITKLRTENFDLQAINAEAQAKLAEQDTISTQQAEEIAELNQQRDDAEQTERALRNQIARLNRSRASNSSSSNNNNSQNTSTPQPESSLPESAPAELNALYKDIYFVKVSNIVVEKSDGESVEVEDVVWYGTGFLTSQNRFVTARHVVEPWYYPEEGDEALLVINLLINNFGGRVSGKLTAYSPSGGRLEFPLERFKVNRGLDKATQVEVDGKEYVVRHALQSPFDIASISAPQNGNLQVDRELSANLTASQELVILGYPLGLGASDLNNISPLYSTTNVARDGLEDEIIMTTNSNIDYGNSGGPVFVKTNNQYKVIGVVSGRYGSIGRIIPVKHL